MTGEHQADLELARACLRRDREALSELEGRLLSRLGPLIGRIDASQPFIDEVVQQLRVALLVGEEGKPPKLGTYSGRGPLAAWINVVALRIALGRKRGSSRDPVTPEPELGDSGEDLEDPELRHIRDAHRGDFQAAFRAALAGLEPRERNVLRLRYIDQLNIDEIGAVYRVHRATVARWIAAAKARIVAETRRRLQARLLLSESQLDSLFRIVHTDLDLSVSLILADAEGAQADRSGRA